MDNIINVEKVDSTFRSTLIAGHDMNNRNIETIYPEKVDRFRALTFLGRIAPDRNDPPFLIKGLIDGKTLAFRSEISEWTRTAMPSTAPEPVRVRGTLMSGNMSRGKFSISDGIRTIRLEPATEQVATLTSMFGQVIEISGIAIYRPNGVFEKMTNIMSIQKYVVRQQEITYRNRIYKLAKPTKFVVTAESNARGFYIQNEELDIFAYGGTLDQAIEAAAEDFSALWHSIADAPIDELHQSALGLRNKIRHLVSEIEERGGP